MTTASVFEALCGFIAVYVGARFAIGRKIPIVSEGGYEPLGWIEGKAAVAVGLMIVIGGLGLLAASIGLVSLP